MEETKRWSFVYGWPSFKREEENSAVKAPVLAVIVSNFNIRTVVVG